MCKENGLPECCTELVSLTFSYTSPQLADKQEVMHDHATGYLLDFTEDRFSKWMQMFESQTQTEYCIQVHCNAVGMTAKVQKLRKHRSATSIKVYKELSLTVI